MKKITILICVLFSLNGMAQGPWDFKTDQAKGAWAAGSNTLAAEIVTEGLEVTWAADKLPRISSTTANLTISNDIMAITLTNNSAEPIKMRVVFPKASDGTNKFLASGSWPEIPANASTSTTYYFDMSGEAEWTNHASAVNNFDIQFRGNGTNATNARDIASGVGTSIIIQKLEFLDAIPAAPGTITSIAAGDWTATSTWDGGAVPGSSNDVIVNHAVRVKKNVTAEMKSLSIGGHPGQLRIDNESSVEVTGEVSITRSQDGIAFYAQFGELGSFTYGSLNAGSTGKRVFVRHRLPKNDAWALISSPVKDSRINEITGKNSTHIVTKGGKFSIASYNDGNASGSKYVYYSSASEPGNTVQIEEGEGHLLKKNNVGDNSKPDYYQRGVLRSAFPVDITISDAGNGFNLLGNPLIGYLNVNDAADGTNNILRVNGTNGSDILAEDTIWIWDSVNASWVTHNLNSASYKMPGIQGFFVKAKPGGGTFSFTKAMKSTSGNTYLKSTSSLKRFEIKLGVAAGKLKRSTSIIYADNATISFDNGYDSSIFGGYASSFQVYTNLVGKDVNKKLAIQSLPNEKYEDMIVPIGVSAEANSQITFTAETLNVPTGHNVYLEDRLKNTFTKLDEANAKYVATVSEKSTEGRFYLHTKTSALSTDTELLNSVSIYKSNAATLRIVGLSQGNTNVSLYNVLGKQVLSTSFSANGVKEISLPKLSKGVYIVQLETETGKLNKKIVLE
ncbi:T9SS type A sorting domain-containing protein [Polaribacter septentrionalilitoris]|uniref:T9SS type A sorting domain-containing protein n=1 Tax=Polaribacter septentrionalilitoris TaxID=2494657 RepID=UPI00135983EA|nr:T9SS type A sorting domain-containing protein [Polaribacter septentrionalilitoris]